mgnify:CR=1 FL=1
MHPKDNVKVLLSTINTVEIFDVKDKFIDLSYRSTWNNLHICIFKAFDWHLDKGNVEFWNNLCMYEDKPLHARAETYIDFHIGIYISLLNFKNL